MLVSIGVSGIIHLIGQNFLIQMFSNNFRVSIRLLELISVPNQSRDSFFYLDFTIIIYGSSVLLSIRVSRLIHLIGLIFVMQMFSFNLGF